MQLQKLPQNLKFYCWQFSQVCQTSTCYILLTAPSPRCQYSHGCMTSKSCQTILAVTCSCTQPGPKTQKALPESQHTRADSKYTIYVLLPLPSNSSTAKTLRMTHLGGSIGNRFIPLKTAPGGSAKYHESLPLMLEASLRANTKQKKQECASGKGAV